MVDDTSFDFFVQRAGFGPAGVACFRRMSEEEREKYSLHEWGECLELAPADLKLEIREWMESLPSEFFKQLLAWRLRFSEGPEFKKFLDGRLEKVEVTFNECFSELEGCEGCGNDEIEEVLLRKLVKMCETNDECWKVWDELDSDSELSKQVEQKLAKFVKF